MNELLQIYEDYVKDCNEEISMRFQRLFNCYELDAAGRFIVTFMFLFETNLKLREIVINQCDPPEPSLEFILNLYSVRQDLGLGRYLYADPYDSPVRYLVGLSLGQIGLSSVIRLRRVVLYYLAVGYPCDNAVFSFDIDNGTLFDAYENEYAILKSRLQAVDSSYVYMSGREGSGRRSLLRRTARDLELPLVMFDVMKYSELVISERHNIICELHVTLVLTNAILCLTGSDIHTRWLMSDFAALAPVSKLIVVIGVENDAPRIGELVCQKLSIGAVPAKEFKALNNLFSGKETGDIPYYNLSAGQIKGLWHQVRFISKSYTDTSTDIKYIGEAISGLNQSVPNTSKLVSGFMLDDLVLTDDLRDKLNIVKRLIRFRESGVKRSAYANCTGILFSGPSGTGKTIAATAIANEMGYNLMRIDLSQMLDKYIGETEKRLNEVFSFAKDNNAILFFDEADALFTKRTVVSGANDRYANSQTAYLLQSVEQHDGVILLATNLLKNIDEAFLRRVNMVIRFSMPDYGIRLRIWEKYLKLYRLSNGVSYDDIAQKLELSPAIIESVCYMAASMAYGTGDGITMNHIYQGLEMELEKHGLGSQLDRLALFI